MESCFLLVVIDVIHLCHWGTFLAYVCFVQLKLHLHKLLIFSIKDKNREIWDSEVAPNLGLNPKFP